MRSTIFSLVLLTIAGFVSAADNKGGKASGAATTGMASFYSDRMNGHTTASLERFNNQLMTAASRDLPLGSHVKVTNLENNQSVVVKVNDRGPYTKCCVISLTKGAAQKLGFVKAGTAKVSIEPAN